jgi:hypothetical protein
MAIPVCASLVVNLIFLINIVRVLVTKLKESRRSFTHMHRRNSSVNTPDSQYSLRKVNSLQMCPSPNGMYNKCVQMYVARVSLNFHLS